MIDYRRQFESIKADAREMLGGVTELQARWQSGPQQWSIAHCVDHLLVSGRSSESNLRAAINEAWSSGLVSQGPFRYGLIERWFVWQTEPPVRFKMRAPKAYRPRPGADQPFGQMLADFIALQDNLLQCVEEAGGLDLARVKVANPVSKLIRFSLGQELALNAAHERRHLWQVRRITEHGGFPRETT